MTQAPIAVEIDAATGEVTERPFTPDELAQRDADRQAAEAAAAAAAAAEAARVQGIKDAQAELKALGLSDAAVATISGYPYPYTEAHDG